MNGDYKRGQQLYYHEDGEVTRVEIVSSRGDENFEKYKLKVLEVLSESPRSEPPTVGETFTCEKSRTISCSGLWHLTDKR